MIPLCVELAIGVMEPISGRPAANAASQISVASPDVLLHPGDGRRGRDDSRRPGRGNLPRWRQAGEGA